jgi:hypothetical protein
MSAGRGGWSTGWTNQQSRIRTTEFYYYVSKMQSNLKIPLDLMLVTGDR